MHLRVTRNVLQRIFCLIAALILSVFLSYTYLSPYFSIAMPHTFIEIIGTAEKNRQSYGTDIRILNVKINHEEVPFSAFHQEGDWKFVDETLFTALNPGNPVSLSYTAADARILEIEFQKQEGSGIIRILQDGKDCAEIDLYSPEPASFLYTADLTRTSLFQCQPLFVAMLLLFWGTLLAVPEAIADLHSQFHVRGFVMFFSLLCLLYLVGCVYYGQPVESMLFVFFLTAGVICSIPIRKFLQSRHNRIVETFTDLKVV